MLIYVIDVNSIPKNIENAILEQYKLLPIESLSEIRKNEIQYERAATCAVENGIVPILLERRADGPTAWSRVDSLKNALYVYSVGKIET